MMLWQHQEDAIHFALDQFDDAHGVLLNHGMGAGKTRVGLELAYRADHGRGVTLVVAPKAAMAVWKHQHNGWPGELHVLDQYPLRKRAAEVDDVLGHCRQDVPTVFVTNYESLLDQTLWECLNSTEIDLVIFDECHRLKSASGKIQRAAARLCWAQLRSGWAAKIPWRIGLSGTPLPHSPLDAYGVFRVLDPTVFGTSYDQFKRRYAYFETVGSFPKLISYINQDDFKERFHSITDTVRTADVIELPEAHHVERTFELPAKAKKVYSAMETDLIADLENGEVVTAQNALVKLLRLRQITSGVLDGERVHTERAEQLRELLDELTGEKVVVFAQFRSDLEDIEREAELAGLTYGEISGKKKANGYEEWLDGDVDVLGVQLQAGAEGIDLTDAAYAIYYSNGFSYGQYAQSLARLHRPGQDRKVTYVHIVAEGTVDRTVCRALQQKKDVVEAVLEAIR